MSDDKKDFSDLSDTVEDTAVAETTETTEAVEETAAETITETKEDVPEEFGIDLSGLKSDTETAPENKEEVSDETTKENKEEVSKKEDVVSDTEISEEKTETKEEDTESSIFDLGETLTEEDTKDIEWNKLGVEFGFEKADTKEDLIRMHNEAVEAAKQKIEPDVSKYGEQAQALIKHLEAGGTELEVVEGLDEYNRFLAMDDEGIVRYALNAGRDTPLTPDELDGEIDRLLDDGKLKGNADHYRKRGEDLKTQAMVVIAEESQVKFDERNANQSAIKTKNNNEIIEILNNTTEYEGLKIPQNVLKVIESRLKSGEIDRVMSTPKAKLKGYLNFLYADKVREFNEKGKKEASRVGYNEAAKKATDELHNIPPATNGATKSVNSKREEDDSPWAGFADVVG